MESFVVGLHEVNIPFKVLAWPNEAVPCLRVFVIRPIITQEAADIPNALFAQILYFLLGDFGPNF
jgi:hypothetical protein